MSVIHNVSDRRHGWIGSWEIEPFDIDKLTPADRGRTVIYRDHGRAEAGTLTSWRDGIAFARYSKGDTAAGADPADLVFGVSRADHHYQDQDKIPPSSGPLPASPTSPNEEGV